VGRHIVAEAERRIVVAVGVGLRRVVDVGEGPRMEPAVGAQDCRSIAVVVGNLDPGVDMEVGHSSLAVVVGELAVAGILVEVAGLVEGLRMEGTGLEEGHRRVDSLLGVGYTTC